MTKAFIQDPTQSTPNKSTGKGHRARLRERFTTSGIDGFLDYEVVELLLTLGTPRKDCKEAAKKAVKKFSTLRGVLSASAKELATVPGIGPKNAFGILLVQAVARRYLESTIEKKDVIRNSKDLYDYLRHRFRDEHKEYFTVIFTDAQNQVLDVKTMFEGTVAASHVYPREILKKALDCHASAILLAHNHPSGHTRPSTDDLQVTKDLVFACKLMGIRVLEHIIVGGNSFYSFNDHGHIAAFIREAKKTLKY